MLFMDKYAVDERIGRNIQPFDGRQRGHMQVKYPPEPLIFKSGHLLRLGFFQCGRECIPRVGEYMVFQFPFERDRADRHGGC